MCRTNCVNYSVVNPHVQSRARLGQKSSFAIQVDFVAIHSLPMAAWRSICISLTFFKAALPLKVD